MHRLKRISLHFLIACLLQLQLAASAWAADATERGAARELGSRGVTEYQAGNYESAAADLDKAFQILQAPALGYWSARAFEKQGRLVEASERYLKTTRLPLDPDGDQDIQRKAMADAEQAYAALQSRIPKLTIVVRGKSEGFVVHVGNKEVPSHLLDVPFPVDPGTIKVVASTQVGTVNESVTVEEGQSKTVTLRLSAAVGPAPDAATSDQTGDVAADSRAGSGRRTFGWISIGVGAGALIGASVTTGLMAGKKSSLGCDGKSCPPDTDQDRVDAYNSLRPVATALFAAGGVLAATGIVLLVTAPKKQGTAHVAPYLGLSSVGLLGSF